MSVIESKVVKNIVGGSILSIGADGIDQGSAYRRKWLVGFIHVFVS
jgi:hypothetical protein